jgi:hypothetical protein
VTKTKEEVELEESEKVGLVLDAVHLLLVL